jgi:Ca2+-dependent lipid-binding protein
LRLNLSLLEESIEQDHSVRGIISAKLAAKQIKNPEKKLFRTPGLISRYVQEILEKDMDVPWVFRSIDDKISKMQGHIDVMKPVVERLIFWENLTGSIAMTTCIFLVYFAGYFEFHILWMVLGIMLVNMHYRRNMIRLRRKMSHDIRVQNARKAVT